MANEQDKNPTTSTESDISKAQSQQQPPSQASQQQPESGQQSGQFETAQQGREQTGDQAATGQGQSGNSPDEGLLQGDTATQQRSDVEGASLSKEKGETQSGFVGAEGEQDTSSELVEDSEFDEGGEGAPEGK